MNTSKPEACDFDVSAWPELPAARGLFVVGTDTGVGKTLVAGAIADCLRTRGRDVEVFKPVASGCRHGGGGQLISADAEFLAACADSARTLAEITPVRYAEPLAPNLAAARAGKPVDLQAIFDGYAAMVAGGKPVIVEGVGGLLCPISDELWVVHLARMMSLPLVIVARPGLGTINHTLLTLSVARSAGLGVAGVVINRYLVEVGKPDTATEANPSQIAALGGVKILTIVGEDPDSSVADAALGDSTKFAIAQVDWRRLIGRRPRTD